MSPEQPILAAEYPLSLPAPADRRALLCVALSGGADSTALTHRLAVLRDAGGSFALRALHVHHGLQPDADAWSRHCQALCRELRVPLRVLHVQASPAVGESPEAAAREARYRALAEQLASDEVVLTAHHADDQAETVLLQLLRGAGVPGLAAMPALAAFAEGWLARPLLGVRRTALRAYCEAHGLGWLEDPSNRDARHDRSYLRGAVMPLLQARWPGAVTTLARAAAHQADAARLLAELARDDLAPASADAAAGRRGVLEVSRLVALPERRRENALRCWLADNGARAPSAAQLRGMLADLLTPRADAMPVARWGGFELRRHAGRLYLGRGAPGPASGTTPWPDLSQPLVLRHGRLVATACTGRGVRAASLTGGDLNVCTRRGGERLRPHGDRHTRELKKLLHATGLPPWQRAGLPLVYAGERLLAVPGVCIADGHAAAEGEPGFDLRWQPADRAGWPDER